MGRQLWALGRGDLVDTYETPAATGDVLWRAGREAPRWPLFHPSEADPDAGYRRRAYAIDFELGAVAPAYALELDLLVTSPRPAFLELSVGGARGLAFLRPLPSASGEIRLRAGLHTAIYAESALRVVLPGGLLRPGTNRLTLTACDDGEVLRVDNAEAVRRLDRMASAAGLVYQRLALGELDEPPATRAELLPSVVHRRGGDGVLRALCELHVELAGPFAGGTLELEVPEEALTLELPPAAFGHLRVPFELADGPAESGYRLSGGLLDERGTLRRRRKWTVHVTPHAHTDIGYTHRQSEVAERQARSVDAGLALDACHVDSAWVLEQWLETRGPNRHAALGERIGSGRFGVSGLYVDLLTQHAALEDLVRNATAAARLLERVGARTDFASVVDVPSISGSLPSVLAAAGLPYLVHASNQDRGPFRVNGALHRSSPYWWEGNGGGRVLVWLAKMYCELRKVCGSPPVPDAARRGLDLWLQEFERDDYEPDVVLLYGQEADNTDLDPQPLDFVRLWNETFEWPRLVPSDVSAFFRAVAPLGDRLPAVRGDGGAYWEDGCGSAAAATALARRAQADLPAAERLAALAALHQDGRAFPSQRFDEAWRTLLLWDEHTWGAFLSAREPDALLQQDQWAVKERFAREAGGLAAGLLHAAATAHSLEWGTDGREVVVWNPASWPCSGAVVVEVERDEHAVDPETGVELPAHRLAAGATQQTVELWVDEVPALGYRRFPLRRGPERASAPTRETELANEHYRLVVDPETGGLASLFDLALGRELVDPAAPLGFGRLVQVLGGEGTRLVSNQADLPDADVTPEAAFACEDVRCEGGRVAVAGSVPGGRLEVEWTLRDARKEVGVRYRWSKEERRAKEAAYVSFAADLPGAEVWTDSQLGWVRWGADDLPGACQEWLPLQTSALARGDGCDLLLSSPDVPLVCVGDVVRGRWPVRLPQRGGRLYSYVLNNYWHTNYPAVQSGELVFRYRIASGARIEPAEAFRRGWEARRGLYAQRISFQDFRGPAAPYDGRTGGALATVEPDSVVLVALKAADLGEGFVARFQEIAGAPARARLRLPGRRIAAAWATDLAERDLAPLAVAGDAVEVDVPPWGLATVRFALS